MFCEIVCVSCRDGIVYYSFHFYYSILCTNSVCFKLDHNMADIPTAILKSEQSVRQTDTLNVRIIFKDCKV